MTLLKNKSHRPLLKEFCENSENVSTHGWKGIKIQKRIVHALPVFKRVL
jgi:hypothetical protein